jgi:hypothetical protein
VCASDIRSRRVKCAGRCVDARIGSFLVMLGIRNNTIDIELGHLVGVRELKRIEEFARSGHFVVVACLAAKWLLVVPVDRGSSIFVG